MNDWYANGGAAYYCQTCRSGFDTPSGLCPQCSQDGRSRQQKRASDPKFWDGYGSPPATTHSLIGQQLRQSPAGDYVVPASGFSAGADFENPTAYAGYDRDATTRPSLYIPGVTTVRALFGGHNAEKREKARTLAMTANARLADFDAADQAERDAHHTRRQEPTKKEAAMQLPRPGDAVLDFILGPVRVARLKQADEFQTAKPAVGGDSAVDRKSLGLGNSRGVPPATYMDGNNVNPVTGRYNPTGDRTPSGVNRNAISGIDSSQHVIVPSDGPWSAYVLGASRPPGRDVNIVPGTPVADEQWAKRFPARETTNTPETIRPPETPPPAQTPMSVGDRLTSVMSSPYVIGGGLAAGAAGLGYLAHNYMSKKEKNPGEKQADGGLIDQGINAFNTHIGQPIANKWNEFKTQTGTDIGNAATGAANNNILGGITSNPYVLGAGIGALGGAGLSLAGGIGSKRKKKDRMGDALTGGLLGAGAGLAGAGLYGMWNGGEAKPPAPPTSTPVTPPAVARGQAGNENPGGLTDQSPQAPAELGTNVRDKNPLTAVQQFGNNAMEMFTRPTGNIDYRRNLDVVDSAASHLHGAAVAAGNHGDARTLNDAFLRAKAESGQGGAGPANAAYATEAQRVANRLTTPAPVGDSDAAAAAAPFGIGNMARARTQYDNPGGSPAMTGALGFGLGGATTQQTATDLADQIKTPLGEAAGGVVPADKHQFADPKATAYVDNPGVRRFLAGTGAAAGVRGLASFARALPQTNDPIALRAQELLRRMSGGTPTPTPPAPAPGFFGRAMRLNPLGGTAPTRPDLSGLDVRQLLTHPQLLSGAVAEAGRAGITVGGNPVTEAHIRAAVQGGVGRPGHLSTDELTRIIGGASRGGGVGRSIFGTTNPVPGGGRGGAIDAARSPLLGLTNPRNLVVGGLYSAAGALGRNPTTSGPIEGLADAVLRVPGWSPGPGRTDNQPYGSGPSSRAYGTGPRSTPYGPQSPATPPTTPVPVDQPGGWIVPPGVRPRDQADFERLVAEGVIKPRGAR